MSNHLHFLILVPQREAFGNSMRFFAGKLALTLGYGKLWIKRVWSRLVHYGRDLRGVVGYINNNPVKVGIFGEMDEVVIENGLIRLSKAGFS